MSVQLKIAMLKAGLSQIELATRLGIHPSSLSRYINGWLIPPAELQEAIKNQLGPHGKRIRFGNSRYEQARTG